MNRTLLIILAIIFFSVIGFSFMYYLMDFGLKKSLIISGGAGVVMLILEFINFVRAGRV